MIIFLVAWAICYHRSTAPNFVRYAPIVLSALSALQALASLMNGSEGHFFAGLFAMVVYLGCAWLGRDPKPQVEVIDNNWTEAQNEQFKRLLAARAGGGKN